MPDYQRLTPGKGTTIIYPTPVIHDIIIVDHVDSRLPDYEAVEYGELWPDQDQFPGVRLVYQRKIQEDDRWIRRTWCNDRVDQDTYNYALAYQEEAIGFKVITRTYVIPREEYAPLPTGTPDPVDADCILTAQNMGEVDDPELRSRYVKVTRVYEKLPGPLITSWDYDGQIDANVATTRQVILAGQPPLIRSAGQLVLEQRPISSVKTLQIVSYVNPSDIYARTEYRAGPFTFPALLADVTTTVISLPNNNNVVTWQPDLRPTLRVNTQFRIVTEFFTTEPLPDAIYNVVPNELTYRGVLFSFNFSSVLNNWLYISGSVTGDATYGTLTENVTFEPSVPSLDAYVIGSEVCIASDVEYWRSGMWIKRNSYIQLM